MSNPTDDLKAKIAAMWATDYGAGLVSAEAVKDVICTLETQLATAEFNMRLLEKKLNQVLTPQRWDMEMNDAWHRNCHNGMEAAMSALRSVAMISITTDKHAHNTVLEIERKQAKDAEARVRAMEEALRFGCQAFDEVDEATPWRDSEPMWWLRWSEADRVARAALTPTPERKNPCAGKWCYNAADATGFCERCKEQVPKHERKDG